MAEQAETVRRGLVHYPLKLARDRWALLRLPADLSRDDADRIIAQLQTMVPEP